MTKKYGTIANLFIAGMVIAALSGCATPIRPVALGSQGAIHKYEKNYALNNKQSVYVGEPVIRIKDYYIEKTNIPFVEPSESFSVELGPLDNKMDYVKGQKYNVTGVIETNGKSYSVIPSGQTFMGSSKLAVLIDNDGVIRHAAQIGSRAGGDVLIQVVSTLNLVPSTAKMTQMFEEKISVSKGYENFELLFSGMDKNTMTFTYREYSPDGIARVAFYQTLTYDAKATSIRYKKFKIDVLNANSEGITYTVVEDGRS